MYVFIHIYIYTDIRTHTIYTSHWFTINSSSFLRVVLSSVNLQEIVFNNIDFRRQPIYLLQYFRSPTIWTDFGQRRNMKT